MKKKIAILFSLLFAFAFFSPAFADVETGQKAPDFTLVDVDGNNRSLSEFQGKYVVLEWTNHGCPFVKKHYDGGNMQNLQKTYAEKGVIWLSINSSAKGKEGSMSPAEWKALLTDKKSVATATLLDPTGQVGKLYGAKTTPHMYIIDPNGNLIYQGAIDSIKSADSEDIPKAQNYVSTALDEAMAGKAVTTSTTKSYGCSVKY